jgi:AbrB family looped-hinge helix DNA binding protein
MGIELKIAANGRVVIPRDVRRALGVEQGGTLVLSDEGSKYSLQSRAQRTAEARALAAPAFAQCNGDPLDDFLADRAEQRIREYERAEASDKRG